MRWLPVRIAIGSRGENEYQFGLRREMGSKWSNNGVDITVRPLEGRRSSEKLLAAYRRE
jgi:hypothetical protein